MYELLILGQLLRHPAHGYLIAKIINDMIGPYARFSNGRLYPLLAQLEQNRFIKSEEQECEGKRPYRRYVITEAGRERFRLLMLDTSSSPGEYQKLFLHKVAFLSFLSANERLYLIDHYLNYCQAHLFHLQNEREDLRRHEKNKDWEPMDWGDIFEGFDHLIAQWQQEYAWAQHLRERELARSNDTVARNGQTNPS